MSAHHTAPGPARRRPAGISARPAAFSHSMGCNHVGGPEMIAMAEAVLRAREVAPEAWPGSRFRFIQNVEDGPWAAVWLELERRGPEWLVVKIERFAETFPEEETGFRVLHIGG